RGAGPDKNAGRAERQSLIFDLEELTGIDQAESQRNNDDFARVAKGETLEIQFGPHQSLALLLAKYRFTLVSGDPFLLLDETGHDLKVRAGKNIVGRSTQSDVVLDGIYGAVSRKHLIIEIDSSGMVKLTDISTLGTFVPKGYVDSKLH
ncbi:MAG TPA: FHA domain-containing protein, partial [Gammaproteobacteria bacterium]